jgi:hypothetical protein
MITTRTLSSMMAAQTHPRRTMTTKFWMNTVLMIIQAAALTLLPLVVVVDAIGSSNSGQRGSNAGFQSAKYGNPCLSNSGTGSRTGDMYYEDAKYVYDDIQAGRFSTLFLKFHNCA